MLVAASALASIFPGWKISPPSRPAGMWLADWRSSDGRIRRTIMAGQPEELAATLRTATCTPPAPPARLVTRQQGEGAH
jgi:hypothetical protein